MSWISFCSGLEDFNDSLKDLTIPQFHLVNGFAVLSHSVIKEIPFLTVRQELEPA